jgi:hypothetical protein
MLALSDGGLAHLCIAATAIAPGRRARWLEKIAQTLEPRSAPNLQPAASATQRGAAYTARCRARQREGKVLLRIEIDEADLVCALVGNGRLIR